MEQKDIDIKTKALEFRPKRRVAKQNGTCRACHKILWKDTDEGIYWHSHMNTGMNIILCLPCADKIGQLSREVVE